MCTDNRICSASVIYAPRTPATADSNSATAMRGRNVGPTFIIRGRSLWILRVETAELRGAGLVFKWPRDLVSTLHCAGNETKGCRIGTKELDVLALGRVDRRLLKAAIAILWFSIIISVGRTAVVGRYLQRSCLLWLVWAYCWASSCISS